MNLTAIRDPEEIVRRHFGESLFAGLHLESEGHVCTSMLDLGSGAGFPGIPVQLLRPALPITLAESQAKKAAFLREVIRTLGLTSTVWASRAEEMPSTQRFHTVTLRAVDNMSNAICEAVRRADHRIAMLGTRRQSELTHPIAGLALKVAIPLPNSTDGALLLFDPA